jgi:hypothetical protein
MGAAPTSVACMTANSALDGRPQVVVLVEGMSDRLALEVLARRRGRDLAADGVAVIAMHGATNLGRYLKRYGPAGLNVKQAGLCDAAEEDYFGRALRRAGIGAGGVAPRPRRSDSSCALARPMRQQAALRALAGRRRGSGAGAPATGRHSRPRLIAACRPGTQPELLSICSRGLSRGSVWSVCRLPGCQSSVPPRPWASTYRTFAATRLSLVS